MFLFAVLYFSERVSFFSMCQGMTRSACAFDAQDLCNTMGVISMCIRFFPFFLNSYDPNIGRTMTSFSMLLINEKSISILLKSNTVDFILEIVCVCVIWIKEKIRCIKMLMMHLTLFRFEIGMKLCILLIKIRFSISFQIHLLRMSPPSNLLFCSII